MFHGDKIKLKSFLLSFDSDVGRLIEWPNIFMTDS